MTREECCANCRAYCSSASGPARCRRHSPLSGGWPEVHAQMWCLEFVRDTTSGTGSTSGAEPVCYTSGLANQPAAPIDQIEAINIHHSASAQAAVALIKGVSTDLNVSGWERGIVLAAQLHHALQLLGVRGY